MNTLITLLGRTGRDANGYKSIQYHFADGSTDQASFLGWPLQRRLSPARMIILGTSTSMWDHLFEGDLQLARQEEELRLELVDKVSSGTAVDPQLLEHLSPLLSKTLGCDVRLVQVPDGMSENQQVELFRHLEGHLPQRAKLYLDCTHGYRHMPMLMLAAGQFLAGLGRASIEKVFYGRVASDEDTAHVFELQGLSQLQAGVNALAIYDRSGDFEPVLDFLAPFLPDELDVEVVRRAIFHERLLRVSGDQIAFRRLFEVLREQELRFPANLLQEQLVKRIAWAREHHHHRRQFALAKQALQGRDFLRALALLFETMVSFSVHENDLGDPNDRAIREHALTLLEDRLKHRSDLRKDFAKLRNLRNSVVHGTRNDWKEITRLLREETSLSRFLNGVVPTIDELTADRA